MRSFNLFAPIGALAFGQDDDLPPPAQPIVPVALPLFANAAALALAIIAADVVAVATLGYASAADAGGARYVRVAAVPVHPGYVRSVDGGYWELFRYQTLTPEMWGAGTTSDDTPALKRMAASINAWHGGNVRFTPRTYPVWTSGAVPNQDVLMHCSGLSHLICDMHGATIATPATDWVSVGYVFGFDASDNVHIRGPRFEQTNYQITDFTAGTHLCYFAGRCSNVSVTDIKQFGGISGVFCVRDPSQDPTLRVSGIEITGEFHNVFYPTNFRRNGDDAEIRIVTHDAGRSYFPYNVRNHRVRISSNNASHASDCLLAVFADATDSAFYNKLEQIELVYSAMAATAIVGTIQPICLSLKQYASTSAAGAMRGVSIRVAVDVGNQSQINNVILGPIKQTHTGAADTTPRGHQVHGLDISGTLDAKGYPLIFASMFKSGVDWTGEDVRGIRLHDIVTANIGGGVNSIEIDAAHIAGPIVLDSLALDTDIVVENLTANVLRAFAVKAPNVTSADFASAGSYP